METQDVDGVQDEAEAREMRDRTLCALLRRNGGRVVIEASELPEGRLSILRRYTESGGIEMVLEEAADAG